MLGQGEKPLIPLCANLVMGYTFSSFPKRKPSTSSRSGPLIAEPALRSNPSFAIYLSDVGKIIQSLCIIEIIYSLYRYIVTND